MGIFSDEECCDECGVGREAGDVDDSPGIGVVALGGDFVPLLSIVCFEVSRAENMRVSRFVIDCFSWVSL